MCYLRVTFSLISLMLTVLHVRLGLQFDFPTLPMDLIADVQTRRCLFWNTLVWLMSAFCNSNLEPTFTYSLMYICAPLSVLENLISLKNYCTVRNGSLFGIFKSCNSENLLHEHFFRCISVQSRHFHSRDPERVCPKRQFFKIQDVTRSSGGQLMMEHSKLRKLKGGSTAYIWLVHAVKLYRICLIREGAMQA